MDGGVGWTSCTRSELLMRITDENGDRVNVHYTGYAAVYNEWKDIGELQDIVTVSEGVDRREWIITEWM